MSVASLQKQQSIDDAVRKAGGDIRKFTSCLAKAKKGTSSKKQECLDELQTLMDQLRKHRDQIRTLSTQCGAQNGPKRKLVDARQRIEHEMKKFEEFTNSTDAGSESSDHLADTASEASSGQEIAETKVMVDQVIAGDGMNDEMVAEFTCRICMVHVVGCGPTLTRCSHLFCGDCIEQWFAMNPGNKTWAQRAKAGGSVPCPVCKEPLHKEKDLHPVSRDGDGGSKMLHKMLSGTRIMCANNPKCCAGGKCDWVGEIGSYQEHIRTCQNLPISVSASEGVEPDAAQVATSHPEIMHSEAEGEVEASVETSFSEEVPEQVDIATEQQAVPAADSQLTDILGAWVELHAKEQAQSPTIEIEDACSTHASEQLNSLEPSDAEVSDHLPSPAASEAALSDVEPDDTKAQAARLEAEQRQRRQAEAFAEAALAEQRRAMQYQAAMQYQQQAAQQAAHYQAAAQYYQAAHYQAAMAQAQMAQMRQYQAAQMAQMQHASLESLPFLKGNAKKTRARK